VKQSDLAGHAGYGFCAPHRRYYWGMKLYLVCTSDGMPLMWCLAHPKIGEREVVAALLERNGNLGRVRQWIESVNDTLKGQLDLEAHGRRTPAAVVVRIAQRLLALAAGIWHNWNTRVTSKRSLTAYDH